MDGFHKNTHLDVKSWLPAGWLCQAFILILGGRSYQHPVFWVLLHSSSQFLGRHLKVEPQTLTLSHPNNFFKYRLLVHQGTTSSESVSGVLGSQLTHAH